MLIKAAQVSSSFAALCLITVPVGISVSCTMVMHASRKTGLSWHFLPLVTSRLDLTFSFSLSLLHLCFRTPYFNSFWDRWDFKGLLQL